MEIKENQANVKNKLNLLKKEPFIAKQINGSSVSLFGLTCAFLQKKCKKPSKSTNYLETLRSGRSYLTVIFIHIFWITSF